MIGARYTWEFDTLISGYPEICQDVVRLGDAVSPRGQLTHEMLGATIVLNDPTRALPLGTGRKLNLKIAAAEAVQLIGARSVPDLLVRATPNFNRFREPDGSFWGAYGDRIGLQLHHAWKKLCDDHDTRQAVITLWDPSLDNDPGHPDYPCTLSLHFMIRDDALDLHVTMRSNDVWWGLAYDAFQFTQLQCTLAASLGISLGRYFHHANSLHAYERDFAAIGNLHLPHFADAYDQPTPNGIGIIGAPVIEAIHRARLIMSGREPVEPSPHEHWYVERLRD